jgi:hypothetical protein
MPKPPSAVMISKGLTVAGARLAILHCKRHELAEGRGDARAGAAHDAGDDKIVTTAQQR